MSEPSLDKHRAKATGILSEDVDGQWRASLLIRNLAEGKEERRGPEFFSSEASARDWIIRQARFLGFGPGEVIIQVEVSE